MSKVIIGIHGRSKKPAKDILSNWWQNSIEEGLRHSTTANLGAVNFEMAYYADTHYGNKISTPDNDDEPYVPANEGIKPYEVGITDHFRGIVGNWLDEPMDWLEEHSHLFSTLGRNVSKIVMEDLHNYYSNALKRKEVNDRLMSLLLDHRNDEIILLSHSMGTIVAYEVLRELGRTTEHPVVAVEHFITMGSPLGLTVVKGNALGSHMRLRTPSCVKNSWVNFSDPGDFVCLDAHLADDYPANSSGIKVRDVLVCNDYPDNQHKSYGYLRTPEFSKHLASIL